MATARIHKRKKNLKNNWTEEYVKRNVSSLLVARSIFDFIFLIRFVCSVCVDDVWTRFDRVCYNLQLCNAFAQIWTRFLCRLLAFCFLFWLFAFVRLIFTIICMCCIWKMCKHNIVLQKVTLIGYRLKTAKNFFFCTQRNVETKLWWLRVQKPEHASARIFAICLGLSISDYNLYETKNCRMQFIYRLLPPKNKLFSLFSFCISIICGRYSLRCCNLLFCEMKWKI